MKDTVIVSTADKSISATFKGSLINIHSSSIETGYPYGMSATDLFEVA